MKTIEKLAVRGGPKHLFGMWKRVFKPKTESRSRAAAKAFKSTKRQAKKGLKAIGGTTLGEIAPGAAITGAGTLVGGALGYRAGRRRERMEKKKKKE